MEENLIEGKWETKARRKIEILQKKNGERNIERNWCVKRKARERQDRKLRTWKSRQNKQEKTGKRRE